MYSYCYYTNVLHWGRLRYSGPTALGGKDHIQYHHPGFPINPTSTFQCVIAAYSWKAVGERVHYVVYIEQIVLIKYGVTMLKDNGRKLAQRLFRCSGFSRRGRSASAEPHRVNLPPPHLVPCLIWTHLRGSRFSSSSQLRCMIAQGRTYLSEKTW